MDKPMKRVTVWGTSFKKDRLAIIAAIADVIMQFRHEWD